MILVVFIYHYMYLSSFFKLRYVNTFASFPQQSYQLCKDSTLVSKRKNYVPGKAVQMKDSNYSNIQL